MKKTLLLLTLFSLFACSPKTLRKEDVSPPRHPPLKKQSLIVIDPGHGGKDFGASKHTLSKSHEKDLALQTALYLQNYLRKMGYRTHLTRSEDHYVPLKERANIANDLEASYFVSVHYNAAKNPLASGLEVYYFDEGGVRTEESRRFAQNVYGHLIKDLACKERGVKQGNLCVIRETKMPAILVEGGFLTHKEEASRIETITYQKTIARAIAQGVKETAR